MAKIPAHRVPKEEPKEQPVGKARRETTGVETTPEANVFPGHSFSIHGVKLGSGNGWLVTEDPAKP